MKFIFVSILLLSVAFGAENPPKGGDLTDLFKKLDSEIAGKKNNSAIEDDKSKYRDESTAEREKNYKEFNEIAKKFHLFRAKKILKTINQLLKEYKTKNTDSVNVQRYSAIGDKKFAYVSAAELQVVLSKLETNGNVIKNLTNYRKLLSDLDDYDIKTIAKVLIIVEQEVMNLMDVGVKKISDTPKNVEDVPMQIKTNQMFKDIKVIYIDKNIAKLQVTL